MGTTEADEGGMWQDFASDMPVDRFRAYSSQIIDWIAHYLENPDQYPVLSQVKPGEIRQALPALPPERPESMDAILRDFEDIVIPGITHWNHPAFFAYFAVTGSVPGMLAEFLAATLNVNAMMWRTSPAATELEETTLDWLRQMLGLPSTFQGVMYDTASISTLVGIAAARESLGLDIRGRGLSGRPDVPRLRLYCSEQAHSSVEKSAITLGIGLEGVRQIAVDAQYRLDVVALQQAIAEDLTTGWLPFCVVATLGTTSTTSVDPLVDIAEVCERYGLWLHVDAVYAGVAAIVPEMRWVLAGAERADSIVFNPHKWLFTQIDLSAFYSPKLDTVKDAFSLVPEYLRTPHGDEVRNYMDYGPQLGRRFRALKLWFVLRTYGREGLARRIQEHVRLAQLFAGWIDEAPEWERMAPVPFSTVCFRYHPTGTDGDTIDSLNERIMEAVNASGEAYLSHTRLRDRLVLRLAVGNLRTTEDHVRRAWRLLQEVAGKI